MDATYARRFRERVIRQSEAAAQDKRERDALYVEWAVAEGYRRITAHLEANLRLSGQMRFETQDGYADIPVSLCGDANNDAVCNRLKEMLTALGFTDVFVRFGKANFYSGPASRAAVELTYHVK